MKRMKLTVEITEHHIEFQGQYTGTVEDVRAAYRAVNAIAMETADKIVASLTKTQPGCLIYRIKVPKDLEGHEEYVARLQKALGLAGFQIS